ncbi:MAG: tyrosine-type recombinase/integrase [Terriglobales bacterium]
MRTLAPGGRAGVLYLSKPTWNEFGKLAQAVLGDDLSGSAAAFVNFAGVAALAKANVMPGLAPLLERSPDGLTVVLHKHPEATVARQEEMTHLWQTQADAGRAGNATTLAAAEELVNGALRAGSRVAKLYLPDAERATARGLWEAEAARMIAAEVGARLLTRRYSELGLGTAEGEHWRAFYRGQIRERWGDEGIERADSGNAAGRKLADLGSGDGEQKPGGPALSHRKAGTAGTGAPGAGSHPAPHYRKPEAHARVAAALSEWPALREPAQQTALRELERGPAAAAFRAWDKATEPLARAGTAVDARMSRYHGVSGEARLALRAYLGRREFAALQGMRIAEGLYREEARLFGRALTPAEGVRIQQAIEQPAQFQLTEPEKRFVAALIVVRDAVSARDVARGWLTPSASGATAAIQWLIVPCGCRSRQRRHFSRWSPHSSEPTVGRDSHPSTPQSPIGPPCPAPCGVTLALMGLYRRGGVRWYGFRLAGRRHRASTHTINRRLAAHVEAAAGLTPARLPSTLAELLPRVVAHQKAIASAPTAAYYQDWSRRRARSHLGRMRLDAITGERIAAYAAGLTADGLAVNSANHGLAVLRRGLRLAVEWGEIERAPAVRLLPGGRRATAILPRAVEAAYLDAMLPELAPIAGLILHTGLRPSEALGLTWARADLAGGAVTAPKKGRGHKTLPLTPTAMALFARQRQLHARDVKRAWGDPPPALRTLRAEHHRVCRSLELGALSLHGLRHTAATRMAEAGLDAFTVAALLGHTQVTTTQRYVHPQRDALARAAALWVAPEVPTKSPTPPPTPRLMQRA